MTAQDATVSAAATVTAAAPEVIRGLDDQDERQDGGWIAWSQVAASFALYFNHLYVQHMLLLTPNSSRKLLMLLY